MAQILEIRGPRLHSEVIFEWFSHEVSPDLAKFRHFGKILTDFGNILGLILFWPHFEPTLAK